MEETPPPAPEQKSHLESLAHHVLDYLDTRWDLLRLDLTEKALNLASGLITGLLMAVFGGMALLFASIGAAIWLGQRMGNPAAGYFTMAGIFLTVLALALIFARNYIRTAVTESVLRSIQDDDDNHEQTSQISTRA